MARVPNSDLISCLVSHCWHYHTIFWLGSGEGDLEQNAGDIWFESRKVGGIKVYNPGKIVGDELSLTFVLCTRSTLISELLGGASVDDNTHEWRLQWLMQQMDQHPEDVVWNCPKDIGRSNPNVAYKILEQKLAQPSQSQSPNNKEWQAFVSTTADSNDSVPCGVLSLFLCHLWVEGSQRPSLGQPDVNGKRFCDFHDKLHDGSSAAVPYQLVKSPDGEFPCKILPMTLGDTLLLNTEEKEDLLPHAQGVELDGVLEAYKVIFGLFKDEDMINSILRTIRENDISIDRLVIILVEMIQTRCRVGFGPLLILLAKQEWGDHAVEKLNQLKLPVGLLPRITLVVFDSKVNLKLGFLMGESIVSSYCMKVLGGKVNDLENIFKSSLTVVQPTLEWQPNGLKLVSNDMKKERIKDYPTGSLMDFVCTMAVEVIRTSRGRRTLYPNTGYPAKIKEAHKMLLEKVFKETEFNPHLKWIANQYLQHARQTLEDSRDKEHSMRWRLEDKDKENILEKVQRSPYFPTTRTSPIYFRFVVGILTTLNDINSATRFLSFRKSEIGVRHWITVRLGGRRCILTVSLHGDFKENVPTFW